MNMTVKEMNQVGLKLQHVTNSSAAGGGEVTLSFIYGLAVDGLNPLDIRLWLDRSLATIGGQAQPDWRLWSRRLAADAWVAVAMAADRDSGA